MRELLNRLWVGTLYRLARPERNHGGPDYGLYWAAQVAEGPIKTYYPGTRSESVCQPRSGCVCGSQPSGCAESQSGGEGPC